MMRNGSTMNAWWRERSARERALLALLSFVALALIAWYGVASPMRSAAQRSEMHRVRAAELLNEVESARTAIGRMVIPADAALDDVLKLSAAEAGFTLDKHNEENAREITVWGHAPEPAALFGWIMMLRKNHGLMVANLTASRDEDGALQVEAVLVRGAS